MDKNSQRERIIKWVMRYCQHYRPEGLTMIGGVPADGHCAVGINYLEQFGSAPREDPNSYMDGEYYARTGIMSRMCCTDGGERSEEEQLARCPKWLRSTREQGEQRVKEREDHLEKFRKVMSVVAEWRTWTKDNRVAKQGVIDCPTGCGGKLHLSQAALNGHVWGKCTTEGCVSWME